MPDTTAPSTPARGSSDASLSSPASSTSTTATSTEKPKPSSTTKTDDQDVIEVSSDVEIVSAKSSVHGAKETKKRKAPPPKSAPSSKKSKPTSTATPTSSSNAKASSSKAVSPATTSAAGIDVSNEVVGFKGAKLEHKQKLGPKASVVTDYLIGRASLIDWAVQFFKDAEKEAKLAEIPDEHLGAIAKDIQESSLTIGFLARNIRNSLAGSIAENMSAMQDSQDADGDDGGDGAKEADSEKLKADLTERIDIDSLRKIIESLADRTNYGLDVEDLPDKSLPAGVSTISSGLQLWAWEVKDLSLLSQDLVSKYERRRTERQEIKKATIDLFTSLSPEDQVTLLKSKKGGRASNAAAAESSSTPSGGSKGTKKAAKTTSDAKGKANAKGKGKAREDDGGETGTEAHEEQEEGEGGSEAKGKGKAGGSSGGIEKKPRAKKVKELTEEEKAEKEEKARIKAEKEAEKEEKRKEREAKRALKAEKDAIEEEKKAQKKQAEDKRQAALKSQKNLMSSFFVKTSPTPGADKSASPSASGSTPASAKKNASSAEGDFARVFHPFTVRPGVEVAPINRFAKKARKVVEVEVDGDEDLTREAALRSLASTIKKTVPKRRIPPYNPYPAPAVSVREAVVAINDSALTSQDASAYYALLKDREKVPVKLLKFHQDIRPGYVGTWSKTSKVVTPRTPFGRDGALLNYEHDSEAEWEDEADDPDAENVGSGGEMSDDEDDNVSEVDSWLADDDDEIEYDEGYDPDGDIVMMDAEGRPGRGEDDDIISVESEKDKRDRVKREKERKKKQDDKAKKKKAVVQLMVIAKGPAWEDPDGETTEPAFRSMKIRFLNDCSLGLDPFTYVSKPPVVAPAQVAPTAAASASTAASKGKENVALSTGSMSGGTVAPSTEPKRPNARPFPDYLVGRFLREIHGSDRTVPVIIDEFVRKMKDESKPVTKGSCQAKWKEFGIKKVKGKHVVPAEILSREGISPS
ncbi:hypothetical protein JCM10212_001385 [Sporobolomyces blumeae]